MSSENYYIGVDVGTGSARVSLLKQDGTIVTSSVQDTITHRDPSDHRIFEQSTTNIWSCITAAVKACISDSQVPIASVKGLGFDATCSLAVTDLHGEPVSVTRGDQLGEYGDRNIVLWADHRAEKEADLINGTGSVVLDYVGGKMSLEMEIPKILWLKRHMEPTLFSRCQFFDLPDFLTYRATRKTRAPATGWESDFFTAIGLGELVEKGYQPIGAAKRNVTTAGMPVGNGLSLEAAQELGLLEGTPVGSGLIDAYAGWLGTVAARYTEKGVLSDIIPSIRESQHRLAAVAGTSTCHLVQSAEGVFVPGVWGPYKDPVFPGWWMNEGGQSSTGQLIDFILTTHPAYPQLVELGCNREKASTFVHASLYHITSGPNITLVLQEMLDKLCAEGGVESVTELTKHLHLYPDLHGNRSPIADARMRGSIFGLELASGLPDLARKYYATLESISLQTRHIIDTLNAAGHHITSIYMSGGQAKNLLLMQLFADVCGMPVVLPAEDSAAVVLGAAMLGRFAAEMQTQVQETRWTAEAQAQALWNIMVDMTPVGTLIRPAASAVVKKLLEAKYKIFRESIEIQQRWRKEMDEATK
ncbi:FGGY family of carbohydrate kinase [Infundibulicybe gibba]|nr:FGGY family of carbohydrate kinase [Infundibulicybe gibba]